MKAPDINGQLSITMQRKHWLRLQAILAVLDEHGFKAPQLVIIRQCRVKFNRALQRANAEKPKPTNEG